AATSISIDTNPWGSMSDMSPTGSLLNGMVMPSFLASHGMLIPCEITDVSTTKKTRLKKYSALGTPKLHGNVARMIGAAPLKPTHETKTRSLLFIDPPGRATMTLNG